MPSALAHRRAVPNPRIEIIGKSGAREKNHAERTEQTLMLANMRTGSAQACGPYSHPARWWLHAGPSDQRTQRHARRIPREPPHAHGHHTVQRAGRAFHRHIPDRRASDAHARFARRSGGGRGRTRVRCGARTARGRHARGATL